LRRLTRHQRMLCPQTVADSPSLQQPLVLLVNLFCCAPGCMSSINV
jgi:hypothetical protein